MKLTSEQISFIEKLGFTIGELGHYQKEDDWDTFFLIVKEDGFLIEVQQTLIEEDGSYYNDYYKEYSEEGQSLTDFLTNFFS